MVGIVPFQQISTDTKTYIELGLLVYDVANVEQSRLLLNEGSPNLGPSSSFSPPIPRISNGQVLNVFLGSDSHLENGFGIKVTLFQIVLVIHSNDSTLRSYIHRIE